MKPSILRTSPLLCASACFITGITISNWFGDASRIDLIFAALSLCLSIILLTASRSFNPIVGTFVLLISVTICGFVMHQSRASQWDRQHFCHFVNGEEQEIEMLITAQTGHGYVARVYRVEGLPVRGKLLLDQRIVLRKEVLPLCTVVRTTGAVVPVSPPQNPYAFDFARFCELRGYPMMMRWRAGQTVEFGEVRQHFRFRAVIARGRQHLLEKLDRLLLSPAQAALAKSMILGERSGLSTSTKEAFTDAGLMHVLAISGLHLGTLYMMMVYLCGLLKRSTHLHRVLSVVLIISVLGVFYFLSGASTSCLRAVIMFSAMELSALFGRGRFSLNALCLSALLMLVAEPNAIFEVGFQLSYLAVLGILIAQPKLEGLVPLKSGLVKEIWKLFTLSISAQILTFPLLLYYFHQFSFLSFLTGVLVVPLTGLVLQCGFLLLVFSAVPILSGILAIVLGALLQLIQHIAMQVPLFISAVVENVWLDSVSLILCLSLSLCLITLICTRRVHCAWSIVIFVGLLLVKSFIGLEQSKEQMVLSVYFVHEGSLGSYIEGTAGHLIDFGTASEYQIERIPRENFLAHRVDGSNRGQVATADVDGVHTRFGSHTCHVQSSAASPLLTADIIWIREAGSEADFSNMPAQVIYIIDGSVEETAASKLEQILVSRESTVYNLWKLGGINLRLT